MPCAAGLSDAQAAEAVRARIDWPYALALEPTFRSTASKLINSPGSVDSPLERRTPCHTPIGVKS
jgi:hypothetical protein